MCCSGDRKARRRADLKASGAPQHECDLLIAVVNHSTYSSRIRHLARKGAKGSLKGQV